MYPFNPTQDKPGNRITGEAHSLTTTPVPFRLVIPKFSPFFVDGLVVKRNGQPLTLGRDYYLTHQYKVGTHITAKQLYGSLYIVNESLAGTLTVDYDTLGGIYTSDVTIADNPELEHTDPTKQLWEDIIGDPAFPPVNIPFAIEREEWQGEEHLNAANKELADAIEGRDPTESEIHNLLLDRILRLEAIYLDAGAIAHIANKDNPHGTTAWQARALNKDHSAADTLKAFTRNLTSLADYINTTIIPNGKLDEYVKLANANIMTGSIEFRDGQFSIVTDDGMSKITFSGDNVDIIASRNVRFVANSGKMTLMAGRQELEVTSGNNDQPKFNGKIIATVDNSADIANDHIDTERLKVRTTDTDTLRWEGDGSAAAPLKAIIITQDATDGQFGVIRLAAKDMTLDDRDLAATPWHIQQIENIADSKVDIDLTVNGKPLKINPSITKRDPQIGKDQVANISDEDMPVSADNRDRLAEKALGTHDHDVSDVNLPTATESVFGIGLVHPVAQAGIKDRAVHRSVEEELLNDLNEAKAKSEGLFPTNILNINAYGDNTYLPAPVTGSFNNASSFWTTLPIVREGNYVTLLRLGRDEDSTGLMLSYARIGTDGRMGDLINTVKEYRPLFMNNNQSIVKVVGGCEDYFIFELQDYTEDKTKWYLVKTNRTMDIRKHKFIEVDCSAAVIDQYTVMNEYENTVYMAQCSGNRFYRMSFPADAFENGVATPPVMEDLRSLLKGNNWAGNSIAERGFLTWGRSPTRDNAPMFYDEFGVWDTQSTYGPHQTTHIEDGVWYIKCGRDVTLRSYDGNPSNRSESFTVFLFINLDTLDAGYLPGTRSHITFDEQGASDYQGTNLQRRECFTLGLGNVASNERGAACTIGGTQYVLHHHVSDLRLVETKLLNGSDSAVEFYHPDTCIIDHGSRVSKIAEGATYDGYRKPFYGWAIGPVKDGTPTIWGRGYNDNLIYHAESHGWSDEGYLPKGFRVGSNGTLFRDAGYQQVPFFNEISGRIPIDGFTIYSGISTVCARPTMSGDNLVVGTKYSIAQSERDGLRTKLLQVINASGEAGAGGYTLLEYSLLICEDAGVHFASITAVNPTSGHAMFAAIQVPSNILTYNGTDITISTSGTFTIRHTQIYGGTTGSQYRSLGTTSSRHQSFITELADGRRMITMAPYYGAIAPQTSSYIPRYILLGIDGDTYTGRVHGASWWGTDGVAAGDWGRPYYIRYNPSQTGLVSYDTMSTFEKFVGGSDAWSGMKAHWMFNLLHDEAWILSFYSSKRLILDGQPYDMPVQNIDLSALPAYKNLTLYIFAELNTSGEPEYGVYNSRTSPNDGVLIGSVVTSDTKIERINIEYSVSLGMFRELERHIADFDDPHGIIGSGAADIGLGNLQNLPMKHEITQIDFSEIFNNWYRFSHHHTNENQPSHSSEINSWVYHAATDTIYTTINSVSYIGFISEGEFGDYQFDATLGLFDNVNTDDDGILMVLAFAVDENGREHTLSVLRSASAQTHVIPDGSQNTFAIWYNYNRSDRKQLVATTAMFSKDNGSWRNRETHVRATRDGSEWTVTATPILAPGNTDTQVERLSVSVAQFPELAIFSGAVRIGYGCISQPSSSFINLRRPDGDTTNSYASREMVQGGMGELPAAPVTVIGWVTNGSAVPVPQGFTRAQCKVIPLLNEILETSELRGLTNTYNTSTGVINQSTAGASGTKSPSTVQYILHAKK